MDGVWFQTQYCQAIQPFSNYPISFYASEIFLSSLQTEVSATP